MTYHARLRVGTVLILAFALLAQGAVLYRGTESYLNQQGGDEVTTCAKRFSLLRSLLPSNSVVGYASDSTSEKDYYQVRYVLSPVRVDYSADHDLVVGNLYDPQNITHITARNGLIVEKDLGRGVMLLRKKGPTPK